MRNNAALNSSVRNLSCPSWAISSAAPAASSTMAPYHRMPISTVAVALPLLTPGSRFQDERHCAHAMART